MKQEYKGVAYSMNIKMLLQSAFVLFALNLGYADAVTQSNRPHIIIIVADDLGWNDVSFHGSPQIPTPNIDSLAESGIILNNYYVSPICTPSRSALLSGVHPIHSGMQNDVIYAQEPYGLPLKYTLLPGHLKKLGYKTHAIGKWHLGFFKKDYTPTYRGFETHFGYWAGKADYYDHTAWEGTDWGLDLRNNMETVHSELGNYATQMYTERAVKLINQHNASNPLFLYVAHLAVHNANPFMPLQAPEEYIKRFSNIKDKSRRTFAAMVTVLDESVGHITKALVENGLLENSIIVFTTDNGGPAGGYNDNSASNWPLRGVKTTLWEGGVRGAALIWSPLLAKSKGRASMQMMHISDWLPTLYHAAGGDIQDLGAIDGINIWNELSEDLPSPRNEILHNIDPVWKVAAIRVGAYKLIYGTNPFGDKWNDWFGPSGRENMTGPEKNRYKSAEIKCGPKPANASTNCKPKKSYCLYNIIEDPCEYNNIANIYPEIVTKLHKRLLEYNSTAVNPINANADARSAPRLQNYIWRNWMDFV